MLSGCATTGSSGTRLNEVPTESASEPNSSAKTTSAGMKIPETPENSDHGYLLEDNRIPRLETCDEWKSFWVGTGPALSFAAASQYPDLINLEVSTQIFLKNQHLDTNGNGILCFEPEEVLALTALPAGVNDPAKKLPAEMCKLNGQGAGVGFPRSKEFLPSSGNLRAVMLFVEFPGFEVTEDIAAEARSYFDLFRDFMMIQSRGQQDWDLDVPDQVFLIDRDPREYRANFSDSQFGNPRFDLYFQDAVTAADKFVDFSSYDVVYVIPPKRIGAAISYGPSFPALAPGTIVSAEGSIRAGATAGNDSRLGRNSEPWAWLAHETGHLYGLSHPLDEKDNVDDFGRELSPDNRPELWDLMSWMRSPSPDFWGWSRFWAGWLDDKVYCLSKSEAATGVDLHLSFADFPTSSGAVELAIIPVTSSTAIAIESRFPKSVPFDGLSPRLLAYMVDVNQGDREGQIRIIPANAARVEGWLDGSLVKGDSIDVTDLTITFVDQTENGILVRIEQ